MTRQLSQLDVLVVVGYLLLIFIAGLWLTKRAGRSVDDFFVGGRHMPWWLIGISMAATNFSIDTPISLTRFVATEGIQGGSSSGPVPNPAPNRCYSVRFSVFL
jgi:Na+/proline symporter